MVATFETITGKTSFLENTDDNRPLSRYNKIRLYINNDGFPVQESWEIDEIEELASDRFFEVTREFAYRLDLISLKFYGTLYLYWVLARVNNLVDPFADTVVGLRLRIPDRENLFQKILI
jgi:hypothetical protein